MQKKIDSLREGDFLYIHPSDINERAYLARFNGLERGSLHLEILLIFEYSGKRWLLEGFYNKDSALPQREILSERVRLYMGEEIRKGMEEMNNPNYFCLERIMTTLGRGLNR